MLFPIPHDWGQYVSYSILFPAAVLVFLATGKRLFVFIKPFRVTSEESTKEGVTTFWDVASEMGQLVCKVRFALITSDIVRQLHRNLPGGDYDALSKCRNQGNL